ncbi:hypothetical protein [Faecalimicrobium dakarense]|uniref:hypothetical protein n=1 Tax=Faecalimicrobium dakarense TaxID=1301100 RepID=UPI0004ADA19C|nr:hypothetical protein [[Clostridium] dakarense]
MKEETIGIIVQNYHYGILLNYIVGDVVKEDEKINDTIERMIKKSFNTYLFRKVKKYKEKLKYGDKEITMYLVELVGYNEEINEKFKFIDRDEILDELPNSNYKDFLRRNIIKYEEYDNSICNLFNIIILERIVTILGTIDRELKIDLLWINISALIISFIILRIYINPKLARYLAKFDTNTKIKILNWVAPIIGILYIVSSVM